MSDAEPRSPGERRRPARAVALVIALGLALQLPSLGGGFQIDDYGHQLVLAGRLDVERPAPWSLYDFGSRQQWVDAQGALGGVPWWTDVDWRVRFLRPLASLSLWLDHALWGERAVGYHATSLALHALLLVLAHRLLLALGLARGEALLGLALFALCDASAIPVGWIANRNELLALLFTAAALLAALRGRALASVALALLALASKESGVVALLLVGLVHARGAGVGPGARRAGVAAACLGLAAAYVAGLALAGFGTRSLYYATPWEEPLAYAARLARLAALAPPSLVGPFWIDVLTLRPELARPAALLAAPLALGLVAWVARRVRGHPAAPVLAAWLGLALLPQGGVSPADRLLFPASLAAAGLLAVFLPRVLAEDARPLERAGGALVLASATLASGGFLLVQQVGLAAMARDVRATVTTADVGDPALGRREVLVLQAHTALVPFALASTWAVERADDADLRFWVLQTGRRGLRWTREDERAFTLETLDEPFLTGPFETVYRTDPAPPAAGSTWSTPLFRVEVLESGPAGLRSFRVRLRDRSLDDPHVRFLASDPAEPERLVAIAPPAVGATRELPRVVPANPLVP